MRLLKTIVFGVIIQLFICGTGLAGLSPVDIKLNVEEFTLENGMLFLVVERHATPQVSCRLAIRAGSALEENGKTGIAHLLEHMMFKGTKNFGTLDVEKDRELQERIEAAYQAVLSEERKRNPDKAVIEAKLAEMERLRPEVQKIYVPQAFSSQLGRNGARGVNAFTSYDQTQYKMSVPSDMIEQWFSIVSEQLFEPSWREFYVEKDVVKREWAFRYINNPNGAAWLDLNATAYTAHPYRNPIIGWRADMDRFNTRDAMAFHKKYYNPNNTVCVLVGDITLDQAKALADIYFGRYPAGERAPETVTGEPPQKGPRQSVRFLKGARTPIVRIGYHGAPIGTKDFYALDMLTMVLSYGRSARMSLNIMNKGLAQQAWAYNPDNRYGGMVVLGGEPNEPDALKAEGMTESDRRKIYREACKDLEKILITEVEKMKTDLVSERELGRIKKMNEYDFLERIRSNKELAGTLATLEVQVGWRYLTTYLKKTADVTPEDIRRVAERYFQEENRTSIYVIPGGKPDRPPEAYKETRSVSGSAASRIHRPASFTNNSRYPTPKGWKHPLSFDRRPEKVRYPEAETAEVEDTTVFHMPDHELPLIDLTLLVRAGSVDVGEDKTGLTEVFSNSLVRGGTETHSPSELAFTLDENAIKISASVREEHSEITLSVIKDEWNKGLGLLKEILLHPRFDPNLVEVVKQQALIALKRQGEDARAVAGRESRVWHFKGHPYGRDPLLGFKTIPALSVEDLRGFLRKHVVPGNMVVAVAGDIEKEKALRDLKGFLRDFPKDKAPGRRIDDPPENPPVLALIHKPGQVQSQVRLTLRGVKRTHPSYWKMSFLTNILGGSDSLMYTRLRDDLGLIYAGWFHQSYRWRAGILSGYLGSRGDKTGRAIEETIEIMNSLREDIADEEIEQKRLDVLNSFVFNVDTPLDLVEVYGKYHMRREPLDTLERIQDAYLSASKPELEDLARKYFVPQRLQIFVVGDKTIRVRGDDGSAITLEDDLMALAKRLGLPYREVALR
jgi:predicted Zn-dependent peptidase